MKLLLRQQALLVIAAVIIFFLWLGDYGLFNDGEATMAGGVAEMSRNGAWVVPTFNEDLQTNHPILADWLMRISFFFFGINEFAARLPSSLLALGTTLLTYHLGRKLYSPAVGFLAGVIVCTSLAISAFGRAATPDSTQIFFETLALTCYVWVVAWQQGGHFSINFKAMNPVAPSIPEPPVESPEASAPPTEKKLIPRIPANWQLAAPMFVAMGFATLATGLAGFGMPLATIFLFLLLARRREDLNQQLLKDPSGARWRRWILTIGQVLRPRPIWEIGRGLNLLIGIGIIAAIALPWYLAVGVITNGAWWREFFWDHHFNRIVGLGTSFVWLPLYVVYEPVVILACCIPWAVFLPVAVYQLRERLEDGDAPWPESDRLLACWLGVWIAEFLLCGAEMPNAVLRICPALALILARYLHDWEREEGDTGAYSFNLCLKSLGGVGAVMILGFYIASYLYFSGEEWLGLIGAVPALGAYVAIKSLDGDHRRKVVQTVVVTAVLTAVLVVGAAPPRIGRFQDSPKFVADARRIADSKDIEVATYEYFEPSLVFYTGKTVRRLSTPREVANFLTGHPHAFVVTRANKHNELRDELPSNIDEVSRRRNFLGREELILLGPR